MGSFLTRSPHGRTGLPDADAPETAPAEATAEDERAERLAMFTGLDARERVTVARLLAEALAARQASLGPFDDDDVLRDTIEAAAHELRRDPAELRRALAEAKHQEEAWNAWVRDNELSLVAPADRRLRAQETLEALNRYRDRLEAKLQQSTTVGAVRERVEARLADLHNQEEAAWEAVHPPAYADDEVEHRSFCACGRELPSTRDVYRLGLLCGACRTEYALTFGAPPPTIG